MGIRHTLNCSFRERFPWESASAKTTPYEGWSVNILPVRSTAVPLPRNELEDQALFAWDTGATTGAGIGF